MTIAYSEIQVGEITFIQRINEDGSISTIPTDSANSDYQAYLNKDNLNWNNQPTL